MENLKKFFQAFSDLKGFDNWMIGKIIIKQQEEIPDIAEKGIVCRIKKRKQRFAVLYAEGQGILIEVFLLKPGGSGKEKIRKNLPEALEKGISRSFSKEEILAFVRETGDSNPIHASEIPVVPGFLMLEWLWELYLVQEMIFYQPVYAGEELTLYFHQETEGCYAVSDHICWEAKGKGKRGK